VSRRDRDLGHSVFIVDGRSVEIDHMSAFHHGHVCIFTVTEGDHSTMYLMHIDTAELRAMSRRALHEHLIRVLKGTSSGADRPLKLRVFRNVKP
jgi:hypothetical protein